jgi:hypothetical protein
MGIFGAVMSLVNLPGAFIEQNNLKKEELLIEREKLDRTADWRCKHCKTLNPYTVYKCPNCGASKGA